MNRKIFIEIKYLLFTYYLGDFFKKFFFKQTVCSKQNQFSLFCICRQIIEHKYPDSSQALNYFCMI